MIVVSDTTPLNYLLLINAVDVLPRLFEEILAEGLVPLPTLAVVERAAERGLLDLPDALQKLMQTSIRLPPALLGAALERDAARKRAANFNP